MASIFDRIAFITRSKTTALLDALEDTEQSINQTIIDAQNELAETKRSSATVIAAETSAKKQLSEYKEMMDRYNKAAEAAVLAGNDTDAMQALDKAGEYEALVATWTQKVATATSQANAMRQKCNELQQGIADMKQRSAEIKADIANANASRSIAKVSGGNRASAMERFDRLAEKAAQDRAEAEALVSLDEPMRDEGADLLDKYGAGGSVASSAKLAELKARLGK